MTVRRAARRNPAVRAEPRGIGSAGARDPLALEVRLLGALLGQVIVEQAGLELLELVERVRRATIALRRDPSPEARSGLDGELAALSPDQAEGLIRAFSLYFLLTNLAEEKQRVRRLRRRGRAARSEPLEGSIAAAIGAVGARGAELASGLRIGLVLTAHPTEARRRTTLVALRRVYRLLDQLDDPRLTHAEDEEIRRRLREEITLLWQTSALRVVAPSPLDEVRAVMAFFDESLFVVAPRLCRAMDRALDRKAGTARRHDPDATDSDRSGARPPIAAPFVRWGSWVGGDRDGNPNVTSRTTLAAIRIQADHVLRGYEAVARRLMQTVAAAFPDDAVPAALAARLDADAAELPDVVADLRRRFPLEPYRCRFGAIGERLRRTRVRLVEGREPSDRAVAGGYGVPADLIAELLEVRDALAGHGLARVAYGDLQDLLWQVETFGFHALALEVRQHSEVHAATLVALDADRTAAGLAHEVSAGVTVGEVLETLRTIAAIQRDFGPAACHRYVISFTRGPQDVKDVLELARRAVHPAPALDIVPLFESADALEASGPILDALLADPGYRAHLDARGGRQEVMLGYSDSTKESGPLAASWMLYRAQEQLVGAAARHGVELTVFHGRGGAIGRGGGPMSRAILASPPRAISGRLKLTEQGEVIAARYANPSIALRHLERMTSAVLLASSPTHEARSTAAATEGRAVLDELAATSRAAWRGTVWEDPDFEAFFRAATPIAELAGLAIGSRPAARAAAGTRPAVTMGTLRAIPWVFSWSQSRLNLPGWFGVGTAIERYEAEHGAEGTERLRALYRDWPFFGTVLDTVELSLAKADLSVAERYARLADGPRAAAIHGLLAAELVRTRDAILRITGRSRLLDAMPELQRSIGLRNPYVDSLSELQVRLLASLRALPDDDPSRGPLLRLVHLTVSGVAAGLQNTG